MSTNRIGSNDVIHSIISPSNWKDNRRRISSDLVENHEIIRGEANLKGYARGKYPPSSSTSTKSGISTNSNDHKSNVTFPMRTITLRGVASGEVKEGPTKRLFDMEF